MGRLHLRNIVFPAVLLSCSIFSALTLPFVLSDPNPLTVKLPPFFDGEVESIFKQENKTLTIRYIGAAIVLSVGAGLVTVEVLRRVQASDSANSTDLAPPVLLGEASLLVNAMHEAKLDGFAADLNSTAIPTSTRSASATATKPLAMAQVGSRTVGFSLDTAGYSEADKTDTSIPVLDEHGNTCRIKTSESEQTAFALMWNGEYYRFFRVRETQEKALAIAKNLVRRGEQVVVSHLEQGYAVWVKETGPFTEWMS
jgi:hypothetical protein